MSWDRQKVAPEPHLLDPAETRRVVKQQYAIGVLSLSKSQLQTRIRWQKRAIEHEQAVFEGMCDAMEERLRQERGKW